MLHESNNNYSLFASINVNYENDYRSATTKLPNIEDFHTECEHNTSYNYSKKVRCHTLKYAHCFT